MICHLNSTKWTKNVCSKEAFLQWTTCITMCTVYSAPEAVLMHRCALSWMLTSAFQNALNDNPKMQALSREMFSIVSVFASHINQLSISTEQKAEGDMIIHTVSFVSMWSSPKLLNKMGFWLDDDSGRKQKCHHFLYSLFWVILNF